MKDLEGVINDFHFWLLNYLHSLSCQAEKNPKKTLGVFSPAGCVILALKLFNSITKLGCLTS